MDEIFTWKEVTDPSLWHLFSAIQHGADGGQPLFYATAWFWATLFGASVLSLRLYSCLCVCGAFLVTWLCIRRVYGLWATAFGVLTIWGASGLLLDQNAEGRFYGLFMLSVAIAVAVYQQLAAPGKATRRLLVLNLIAQAALVLTHILGLIYSGLILAALMLFDAMDHRFRIKVYLSHAAGCLALLFWIPAIRASMAAGKPHSWIPIPTLKSLYDSYLFWAYLPWLSLVQRHSSGLVFQIVRRGADLSLLLPLVVVLGFWLRNLFRAEGRRSTSNQENALQLIAFALLLAPAVLFVLSVLVTPVLISRYVLPSAIGMAIVLAVFANWLSLTIPVSLHTASRQIAIVIVIFLVGSPILSALIRGPESANWRFLDVRRLDGIFAPQTPVVVGWQQDFSKLMRYSREPQSHYYFLLDWPAALAGPRTYVLDYHLMRSYRDAGYYSKNIQDSMNFLCSHADFVVLDSHASDSTDEGTTWFDYSIRNNPSFLWNILASLDGPGVKRELVAVHRQAALSQCDKP
ncbi:MAG: hypothetical protein WA510_31860 [Acidobacteriaceae bacterium]